MTVDAETLAAIKEAVTEGLKTSVGEIELKLEIQKRELLKNQETLQQQIDSKITGLSTDFETKLGNIQKPKEETKPGEDNTTSDKKKEKIDITAIRQEFEAKLAEDRKRVTELELELNNEREKARQDQEKATYTTYRNEAISAIQQLKLVAPGKETRLLTLLEQEGLLTKTDNGFKVKGKNKFDDEIALEIKDALPDILKNNYDEYLGSRPGTGTSAQPAKNSFTPSVDFSTMTPQQIYEQGGNLEKDLIATLEQTYSQ